MSYRSREFDIAHTVTAHTGLSDFNTTPFTHNATMADALVFTTMTFPIFRWAKDSLAEKTIHFRLEGAVIDGFGLGHFTHHLAVG